MLAENDAVLCPTQQLRQRALAFFNWRPASVVPFQFKEIECAKRNGMISPPPVCQSKIQNGDLHHSAKSRSVPSFTMRGTVMLIYEDLVELARMCARNARITTTREVADELWRMAKEYQAQAAEMGDFPEIGDEPPLGSRPRP